MNTMHGPGRIEEKKINLYLSLLIKARCIISTYLSFSVE